MQKLLLVTNLAHEDRGEDLFLAERLAERFDVCVVSPGAAAQLLAAGAAEGCMIRNAWPGREFKAEFEAIERLAKEHRVGLYNPIVPGRRGPVENKAYLVDLFEQGRAVIPTYATLDAMAEAGFAAEQEILAKPVDGCSSAGIVECSLGAAPHGAFIYQPRVAFSRELSFYFVDGDFAWAMRSAGPRMADRWDLAPHAASDAHIEWAAEFVRWNGLPYGIERVDAAEMPGGELLLMEVEDSTPFLSLAQLEASTREAVVEKIIQSVARHARATP
jgi:hypothetical protein